MTGFTQEEINRWRPRRGFGDFARVGLQHILLPEMLANPFEVAHQAPATAMMLGLAHHAAIGRPSPVFVEIGVQKGLSTRALLAVASATNGRVVSMDIDPTCGEGDLREWVRRHQLEGIWEFHGNGSQNAPVTEADFLLVDGDHRYDAVVSDMARHGVAVRDGGIVVLDDYYEGHPGKARWIMERWRDLSPLTIGPWAIVTKTPAHNEVFSRTYVGTDEWDWDLR